MSVCDQSFINSLTGCSDVFIRLLFEYRHIKTIQNDNQLHVSENFLRKSFLQWHDNHYYLDKELKNRKEQLKRIGNCGEQYFFMIKNKKTDLLSFVYHLRNAIAHGEIIFEEPYIIIKDYKYINNTCRLEKTPSAFFRVLKDDLIKFIITLIDKI